MGRIRTVKPELFDHEGLFDLEEETGLPIRIAFIGLFTQCDREGRFKWRPGRLGIRILPYDDVDFSRVLDALSTRGFVVRYEVDSIEYGHIPTWLRHQFINNRESESEIPEPPEIIKKPDAQTTRHPRALSTAKGKGRERKGKEESSASGDALLTKRKRKLTGRALERFNQFWDDFGYKHGKREAADKWLDIAWEDGLFGKIIAAAKREAARRPGLVADGRTPKMAEGWISGCRWEDAAPVGRAAKQGQTGGNYRAYPEPEKPEREGELVL